MLKDQPEVTLRLLIEELDRLFPPSIYRKPEELKGDNVALQLAFSAGQQSVLTAVRAAIKQQGKESNDPRDLRH